MGMVTYSLFTLIFFMGLISFISAGVYVVMHTPYQMNRIRYWLNPYLDPKGHGYNLIQSTKAIASGGIFGLGARGRGPGSFQEK